MIDKVDISNDSLISATEFAQVLGVTQGRVSQAVKAGKLKISVKKKKGRIYGIWRDAGVQEWSENIASIQQQNSEKAKKTPNPTVDQQKKVVKSVGIEKLTLHEAQTLKTQYQAAILKLDFDAKNKDLIPTDQIEKEWSKIARNTRDAILSVPDRVSAILAAENDQFHVSKLLTDELNSCLNNLVEANW